MAENARDNYYGSSAGSIFKRIWINITVEPALLMYVIAYGLNTASTNALWIQKVCIIKLNLTEEICANYKHTKYEAEIQKWDTTYMAYASYIETFPAAIYTIFVGAWTDKYGRRLPILTSPLGYALFFTGCIICVYVNSSPRLLLIPFIFNGLSGSIGSLMVGCMTYVSDVSTIEGRTMRLAIVEAIFFLGLTLGNLIGSQLTKHGFYSVYGTGIGCCVLSFLYTFFILKESKEVKEATLCKKVIEFFDWRNLKSSIMITFRKREGTARAKIIAAVICSCSYVIYFAGEANINFVFTNRQFGWDYSEFSIYQAFFVLSAGMSLLISLPILTKILHLNDVALGVLGSVMRGADAIVIIFAKRSWMMYLGTGLTLFSGGVTLPIRAIASKAVPIQEVGKIFALLGCIECSMPLVASVVYTNIFRATLETFPSCVFILTAALCGLTFSIFLIIYIIDSRSPTLTNSFESTEQLAPQSIQTKGTEQINDYS